MSIRLIIILLFLTTSCKHFEDDYGLKPKKPTDPPKVYQLKSVFLEKCRYPYLFDNDTDPAPDIYFVVKQGKEILYDTSKDKVNWNCHFFPVSFKFLNLNFEEGNPISIMVMDYDNATKSHPIFEAELDLQKEQATYQNYTGEVEILVNLKKL